MNIMFVCTGNICRSAMAHWMLEKKMKEQNRDDIQVYSCGLFAETGEEPTNEAIKVMKNFGVDLTHHKAVNVKSSNIREVDLILCATNSHKLSLLSQYPELEGRVYTLKEYVGYDKEYHKKIDLDDPWGYGEDVYRFCALEIDDCLNLLLEKIEKEEK